MSPSVLDKIIRQEKKIPPEYSTAENCVEMQVGALLNLYVANEQKFLFTSMYYEWWLSSFILLMLSLPYQLWHRHLDLIFQMFLMSTSLWMFLYNGIDGILHVDVVNSYENVFR